MNGRRRSRRSVARRIDTSSMPAAAQARQIAGSQLRVERRDALDPVRRHDRCEDLDPPAGRDERRDAGQGAPVQAEHATQQRTPRERDGDEVRRGRRAPCRRGSRRRRRGRWRSHGPRRAARRDASAIAAAAASTPRTRERRLGACPGEHRAAVTGTDIGDHPVGPGDQAGELADVDVDDAPADDLSHGRQSTLGP